MYAIIRTGGKQAKVRPGDVIEVERLKDAGDQVTFTPLLVVGEDGAPISDRSVLSDATVTAKVLGESPGPKLDIFKYKNKSGYRRRMGHRQVYTTLEVTGIEIPGSKKKTSKKASAAKQSTKTEAEAVAETTPATAEEEE